MDTLYELSQTYADFLAAVESGEIPDEAIQDTLEGLGGEITNKADSIACIIKQLNAEAAAIKAEETALTERRQAKERRRDSLKDYLSRELEFCGISKVETARTRISFRPSAQVNIADMGLFEGFADYKNYVTYKDPVPDKKAISEALKSGIAIPGCEIVEKQNIQIK